jgi:hypothetical protein
MNKTYKKKPTKAIRQKRYFLILILTAFFFAGLIQTVSTFNTSYAMTDIKVPKKQNIKILNIDGYIKTIKVNIKRIDGSVASKTNNPCNLKFAHQPYATRYKEFAKYQTPELGFRACIMQIRADQKKGKTLERFITVFSPPYENDTELYIKRVASNLKADRKTLIAKLDLLDLTKQMALFESQTQIIEL